MIEIQQASAHDLPQLAELAKQTWWHNFPGMISPEQIEYMLSRWYTSEAMLQQLQQGEASYVKLIDDGKLVGFASYSPQNNEKAMRLHRLYIHPSVQRSGYGSALLRFVEKRAMEEDYNNLTLSVNKNNKDALSMYLHRGFVIHESTKTDIGGGFYMDDYVMVKPLPA